MSFEEILRALPPGPGEALLLLLAFGIAYKAVAAYVDQQIAKAVAKLETKITAITGVQREAHALTLEGMALDLNDPSYPIKARAIFHQMAAKLG